MLDDLTLFIGLCVIVLLWDLYLMRNLLRENLTTYTRVTQEVDSFSKENYELREELKTVKDGRLSAVSTKEISQ